MSNCIKTVSLISLLVLSIGISNAQECMVGIGFRECLIKMYGLCNHNPGDVHDCIYETNPQVCKPNSIPATTPTDQFIDNRNGTVSDKKTGLMWKRCSEGQSWTGTTCTGEVSGYSWQGALRYVRSMNTLGGFAGKKDWRLPNIKELQSIVEMQCTEPAANLKVFPATPSSLGTFLSVFSGIPNELSFYPEFISSSPDADNPGNSLWGNGPWSIGFSHGNVDNIHTFALVRLVRGGQ